ncbi:MAG: glycoside hydrolase 100 family protein [Verrucomicrobiota bacterium]
MAVLKLTLEIEHSKLVEKAVDPLWQILEKNISDKGLAASVDNYPQVWTRDTVICFLGGCVDGAPDILEVFKLSLETLGSSIDQYGQIPFSVSIATGDAAFGSKDSNPWWVIGALYYYEITDDLEWINENINTIIRALDWCHSQDTRHSGLMESGECDDWADLLYNRGQVLFPNILYAHALKGSCCVLKDINPEEAAKLETRYFDVREAIQNTFWVMPLDDFEDKTHTRTRLSMSLSLRKTNYFLPWINHFEFGERFDTAGNLLAILCDVASPEQSDAILDFIDAVGINAPYPVKVLYPPIQPGEEDWRDYYKDWLNNLPHQYHNGGIWPWVGGLYVAALVKAKRMDQARSQLNALAECLNQGTQIWECNEWMHGATGKPMGAKYQAWSAGMFFYAKYAVETGDTPGFRNRNMG